MKQLLRATTASTLSGLAWTGLVVTAAVAGSLVGASYGCSFSLRAGRACALAWCARTVLDVPTTLASRLVSAGDFLG